jgi:hypothetical protein
VPGDVTREVGDEGLNGNRNLRRDFEALRADLASMREHLRDVLGDVKSGVGAQVGKATGTLKDHPIALLAGAFCAGFALSALLLRR